jgi:hypothetical protein
MNAPNSVELKIFDNPQAALIQKIDDLLIGLTVHTTQKVYF